MSFWRKLNKVVFIISLVVMCLAVLGFSAWGFSQESWLGIVIFVGGAVLVPVLFSTWGILLEFLDNVAAIRQSVCGYGYRAPVQTAAPINTAVPTNTAEQTSGAVQTNAATYVLDNGKWVCGGCGRKNDIDAQFCVKCGHPKN